MNLSRRKLISAVLPVSAIILAGGTLVSAAHAATKEIEVYKSPSCGCCGAWARHMQRNGFKVRVHHPDDLEAVKTKLNVPQALWSCHTAVVAGYVIEGHVPASDVTRLLAERPTARGLAVPGMPIGSPGMEQGSAREAYQVILFGEAGTKVFARH